MFDRDLHCVLPRQIVCDSILIKYLHFTHLIAFLTTHRHEFNGGGPNPGPGSTGPHSLTHLCLIDAGELIEVAQSTLSQLADPS